MESINPPTKTQVLLLIFPLKTTPYPSVFQTLFVKKRIRGDTSPAARSEILATIQDESILTFWKRRIAESCLYGVDNNDLAVELAKLALWLETISVDQPLTFLDHHMRIGNSLIGATISKIGVLPREVPITRPDQIVGQVADKLPIFLQPLAEIRTILSETPDEVTKKKQLYRKLERARQHFVTLANIWCSRFASEEGLTAEDYQRLVDVLGHPRKFAVVANETQFQDAEKIATSPEFRCFQWQLQFPEIFFEEAGQKTNPGFDVIIGNPPYDVLSELETKHTLSALRAFIDYEPSYRPTTEGKGKKNLYSLFICRSLSLLADGGYLGFITPMPILGDQQAIGIRRALIENGRFITIEAFPQKDNPKRRIFPEAKLSTAVFVTRKERESDSSKISFTSQVHPGNDLSEITGSLTLCSDEIPLYDPSNMTVVSCSQDDWDLATRIMSTNRLERLTQFAESFQGEVNETTDRVDLSDLSSGGPLILRGSTICLYAVRTASQGENKFLLRREFLERKSSSRKVPLSQERRVGFQRSSPQNNFRRLIAAIIEPGNFCFDTVSFIPESTTTLPLEFLVGLLNSELLDWYFRLGSTNSKVNEYQFNNLPCPVFTDELTSSHPEDCK